MRGSGQDIVIEFNPQLTSLGRTRASNPNVIEIGPSAFVSESELANTIAHELNHARSFWLVEMLRNGGAMVPILREMLSQIILQEVDEH